MNIDREKEFFFEIEKLRSELEREYETNEKLAEQLKVCQKEYISVVMDWNGLFKENKKLKEKLSEHP